MTVALRRQLERQRNLETFAKPFVLREECRQRNGRCLPTRGARRRVHQSQSEASWRRHWRELAQLHRSAVVWHTEHSTSRQRCSEHRCNGLSVWQPHLSCESLICESWAWRRSCYIARIPAIPTTGPLRRSDAVELLHLRRTQLHLQRRVHQH